MPAASGFLPPSADGDAAAAAAAVVLLVEAPVLPPSGSRGQGSSRRPPRMPSGSTGAPAAATGQQEDEEEEENATCRKAREGEGHRRTAAQPPEAEQDVEDTAVAAMLCISRPNSAGSWIQTHRASGPTESRWKIQMDGSSSSLFRGAYKCAGNPGTTRRRYL